MLRVLEPAGLDKQAVGEVALSLIRPHPAEKADAGVEDFCDLVERFPDRRVGEVERDRGAVEHLGRLIIGNVRRGGSWDRKGKIYPSDLGNEGCPLGMWRKLHSFAQKKNPPGTLMLFEMGSAAEDVVGASLVLGMHKRGWALVFPPPGKKQHKVSFNGQNGKIDFLFELVENPRIKCVVEIKSKRGNAFRYLPEAKPNNVLQARFYQAALHVVR